MKKLFKIFSVFVVFFIVSITSLDCFGGVKILVVATLSTELKEFGESTVNGVKLKVDEINREGGVLGRRVSLVVFDDESNPEKTNKDVSNLLSGGRFVGIVGAPFSRIAIGLGEVSDKYKIPFISSVATNPLVTKGREYAFRACFTDDIQGKIASEFIYNELNGRTGGVLYDISDPYSTYLAGVFKNEFEKLGGKIIAFYPHPYEPLDFSFPIQKMLSLKVDFVFCPDLYRDASMIYSELRKQGFVGPVVFGDGVDAPQFLARVSAPYNAYYISHYSVENEKWRVFVENYWKTYKKEPDIEAYLAYDAMGILLEAIRKAGSSKGELVKNSLKDLTYEGITGKIEFRNAHDPVKPVYVYGFKGSNAYLIKNYTNY